MREIHGNLNAEGKKICIVLSRFNDLIGSRLLEGARDCLLRHGMDDANLDLIRVPGAFEIPLASERAASSGRYDAVICLGAVIRGDTPHFELVCAEVSRGIGRVSVSSGVPVIFGVITTDNMDQAIDRSGGKVGNKGWDAALAAIEMTSVLAAV